MFFALFKNAAAFELLLLRFLASFEFAPLSSFLLPGLAVRPTLDGVVELELSVCVAPLLGVISGVGLSVLVLGV